jgi:D-alanyl-D-alanine carboxypeptidase
MRKLLLLPALLFVHITFAQIVPGLNTAKLDSLFSIIANKNKGMVSVAIMQDGKPVYSKAVGYSQISPTGNTPATTDTRYRIGSISKMFTGVMIFQLIQEGKLSLSTPLAKFYPELPNAAKITIGNLLNHSSGLFNFTSATGFINKVEQSFTHEEALASFNVKPVFEPGAKHEYSNTNFVLLGYIIEKLDKKTYAEAVKKRITDKIGLNNTYYGSKITPANKEATSYQWTGSWAPISETNMSIPAGAGAMVSTPGDLTIFLNALFNGKLINETSLSKMKTLEENYGMAMFMRQFGEKQGFGHNGGIDAFQSNALYYPEDKLAVALIGNGFTIPVSEIWTGMMSIYYNKPYTIPTYETYVVKAEELDQYLGVYSSPQFPLKVTITKKDATLFAQASGPGQGLLPLEPSKAGEFKVKALNVTLNFDPAKGEMAFEQNGTAAVLKRETAPGAQ